MSSLVELGPVLPLVGLAVAVALAVEAVVEVEVAASAGGPSGSGVEHLAHSGEEHPQRERYRILEHLFQSNLEVNAWNIAGKFMGTETVTNCFSVNVHSLKGDFSCYFEIDYKYIHQTRQTPCILTCMLWKLAGCL